MTYRDACAPVSRPLLEPASMLDMRRRSVRVGVGRQLTTGPKTVGELAATVSPVPQLIPRRCGPGCGGHPGDMTWRQPTEVEIRRVLKRLEREDLTTRFVLEPGVAHLWALNPHPAYVSEAQLLVDELPECTCGQETDADTVKQAPNG